MSTGGWNDGGTGDWSTPAQKPLGGQSGSEFGRPPRPPGQALASSAPTMGAFGTTSPMGAPGEPMTTGHPPLVLLAVAAAMGALGLLLGLIVGASQLAIIGWVLAGPVAFTVVAVFSLRDTAVRARGLYLQSGATLPLHVLAILLAFAGVAVCAVQFALWVGRL